MVARRQPHRVGRDLVEAREHVGRELVREEIDALVRQLCAVLVHRPHRGQRVILELDLAAPRARSPARDPRPARARRRPDTSSPRRAERGDAGRATRARARGSCPCARDRSRTAARRPARAESPRTRARAPRRAAGSRGCRAFSARANSRPSSVEPRLVLERAHEEREALAEAIVAEVGEAGRRLGGRERAAGVERHQRAAAVARALAERVQLRDPRRARRRGPGHLG